MKFIISISNRIRHGQYPRLPDFQYSQDHGKYLYQGRELTLEEFNAAAAIVFAPTYRNNSYSFCPLAIQEVVEAKPAKKTAKPTAES